MLITDTLIYPHDVEDELLSSMVNTTDCEAATAYVLKVARGLNVAIEEIPTDPVPLEVKDLAIAYACGRRAKLSSGVGGHLDASSGFDTYELKRRIYAKELQALTIDMTAAMMKGSVSTTSSDYAEGISLTRG